MRGILFAALLSSGCSTTYFTSNGWMVHGPANATPDPWRVELAMTLLVESLRTRGLIGQDHARYILYNKPYDIYWVHEPFPCLGDGICTGTHVWIDYQGTLTVSYRPRISDTSLVHEIMHAIELHSGLGDGDHSDARIWPQACSGSDDVLVMACQMSSVVWEVNAILYTLEEQRGP